MHVAKWQYREGLPHEIGEIITDLSFKFYECMNKMIPVSPSAFN